MATNKDIKRIERAAKKQGWTVERRKTGHLIWRSPLPGFTPVRSSHSPSDQNAYKNLVKDLKARGFVAEG